MNTSWQAIIGHKAVKQQLQTMQQEDRIPHAMLFCGMEGIGKNLAAEALAAVLLCHEPVAGTACGVCPSCRALAAGTHPDYFTLEPMAAGKAAKSIKIDAVRELQSSISRVPLLSQRRVVIIREAEKMNEAAANCLLKTIEEPTGQVAFILETSAPAALLDTIISRCMRVEFGVLSPEELRQILIGLDVEQYEAERLSSIADGSVARALALREPVSRDLQQTAFKLAEELGDITVEKMLQLAKDMSAHSREELTEWLGFLMMIYRDLLILYTGSKLPLYNQSDMQRLSALLGKYPQARLLRLQALLIEYQKRLRSNVNLQLCLEGLLIRLQEIML